jgi:hypothetical protein
MISVRRRFACLGVLVAVAVAATTAFAATQTDPDDVTGKLDVKTVGGSVKGQLLTFKVGTYDSFSVADIPRRGGISSWLVEFDTNGDGTGDYKVRLVSLPSGKYTALISGGGSSFEPVPLKRKGNTLTGTFPADAIAAAGDPIAMATTSSFRTCTCTSPKVDRAPDEGWVTVRG